METRIVEVDLGGGATALVRAVEVPDDEVVVAEKVGFADRLDFADVTATLAGVSEALRTAVAAAKPQKMTVELGIELALKSGKLTGLIVEGSGKAALKVTLTWERAAGAG